MAAEIFHLRSVLRWSFDWSQQELAEFYRVESALIQAGFSLETDRGMTDEGEPWFVFCRTDDSEVFIHFARIGGEYLIDAAPLERVAQGPNFAALVREVMGKQPLTLTRGQRGQNVFVHPAALLIALVGSAFFHTHEAKAATTAEGHGHGTDHKRQFVLTWAVSNGDAQEHVLDSTQAAAIMAGVMIGLDRRMTLAVAPLPAGEHFAAASGSTPPPSADWIGPPPSMHTALNASQWTPPVQDGFDALSSGHALAMLATAAATVEHSAPIHIDLAATSDTALAWGPLAPLPAPTPALPLLLYASTAGTLAGGSGDAAQVIQLAENAILGSPATVLQVSYLPEAFLDLVRHGVHADQSPATTGSAEAPSVSTSDSTSPPADSPPPVPDAPGVGASSQPTGAAIPDLSTTGPLSASSGPTANDATAGSTPPPPPPPPAPAGLSPNDAAVTAAVTTFLGEVHSVGEYASGNNIVIYDNAIMSALPKGTTLASLTFDFTDGSSLSLVGTSAEIHALHWAQ